MNQNFRLEPVEYAASLRPKAIGIVIYMVDEAIRGVVPPTEWEYPEYAAWFDGFVRRLHERFTTSLSEEQREAILNIADMPLDKLYSFYLDPQVAFESRRYLPDPDLNAFTYFKRAYGVNAARELCTQIKEQTMLDPSEVVCYAVGDTLRYLEAIW